MSEPLLTPARYTVFKSVIYPELEKLAETQEKLRWRENEVQAKLHEDLKNWQTMSKDEQHFIKQVLSFSVVSDGLVNCNLLERFTQEVTDPSARRFYLFQGVMEEVHMRTYGLMLSEVVTDKEELARLMSPHEHIPSIKAKIDWIEKWIKSDAPFGQRLVAFAIIEGVFFSSLFCSFYWLKHKGSKLPGMIMANEFIARDEGLHCDFALTLLKYVKNKPTKSVIESMMREAIAIEHQFVEDALPVRLIGINAQSMCQYVDYMADRLLTGIACEGSSDKLVYCQKIFNVPLPLRWMETISIQVLSNFFEKPTTDYQDAVAGRNPTDNIFSCDVDDII